MKRAMPGFLLLCLAGVLLAGPVNAGQCDWPVAELGSRPLPEQGPTEVTLRLYVNDMVSIHDVDQSFVADVFFRADWHDPRLAHTDAVPCLAQPGQIWTPVLQLLNRREVQRIREPELTVSPDGGVTLLMRAYGEFSFHADLSDFPFDQQELMFKIVSNQGVEDVRLTTQPELIGMAKTLSVANWKIRMDGTRSLTEYIPPVDRHLVRMDVVLRAERQTGYYTWQQLVPLFLVVMMTWVVFWIPHEYVPPRVGLAATAMLTLIAYRFAMSSVLPPIAYLTRLDIFIIGASILVYAGLAVTVAVSYIFEHKNDELAQRVNRNARWLSPLFLLLLAAVAFFA